MHRLKEVCCVALLSICLQYVHAQAIKFIDYTPGTSPAFFTEYIKTDSGVIRKIYHQGLCRNRYIVSEFFPYTIESGAGGFFASSSTERPQFLVVHGNIYYDFMYRSKIDTPINLQNFQQHTERVNLDVLIREKYPLKISFITRQSNSPYFRNFIDMNMHFDEYGYNKDLKQQLIEKLTAQVAQNPDLKSVTAELNAKMSRYNELKGWLSSGATLQKIIEEKERKYKQNLLQNQGMGTVISDSIPMINEMEAIRNPEKFGFSSFNGLKKKMTESIAYRNKVDSLILSLKDSSDTRPGFIDLYNRKQKDLAKLEDSIKKLQGKADSIKSAGQMQIAEIKRKIYKATNEKDLKNIAHENGIEQNQKDRLETILGGIKTLGIGKSMLNYTELTAQNITVTGVNIEYNPSWYAAFAAGKIDYRFRDFFNRNTNGSDNQYLVLGRAGIGDKDRKALILSVFQGRKSTSQFGISDSINSAVNVLGYSLEGIVKKDEYTSFSAEFAKSTKPVSGSLQVNKQAGAMFKFSDYSNAGINLKAQTTFGETNTKLSGFFRRTGKDFQSFSLFSYNTDQTAWLIRADQPFFKSRVTLTGMLRQNDFTNPFTEKTFKTSTTFKSVLLNIRIPKYPSLSFGYYPGTQLYFVDKEKIRENAYYILNGSLVHSYFYDGLRMNSSLVYNRYFNQATDSGFVLNKGINYYASQTVFFRKLQVKAGYAYSKQRELSFYTLESSADYSLKTFLKVGAGLKRNKIINGVEYWGPQLLLSADSKKFGGMTIQYEKSFLPTFNNTLAPLEIGRVSWYKIF